jgi:hypothetical protein
MRHELTQRLGVEWGPVHKGAAEIVGIPPELCELFSTRRHEIEEELAARGSVSPQAARAAALDTRQAKAHSVDPESLREGWTEHAWDAGFYLPVDEVLDQTVVQPIDSRVRDAGITELLGPEGLTAHSSVFSHRDVLRAWCERLPAGAPITTIEQLASATIADARAVALTDGAPFGKFSTTDLVTLEHRLVDAAVGTRDAGRGLVPEPTLRAALGARLELSPEQVAAVATLTTSGNGVDVFIAAAGTGKTFCLDAAHDAWARSGFHVVGASLAATAAAQLQAQTAIPSDTLALRELQLADGSLELDDHTVVVVDEAAMVGTRQLAVLLDAAHEAKAKVVLVGDPKQLSAIHAGGLLSGLSSRLPTVTLEENRRQQEAWERDALARLRDGEVEAALELYDEHDRIVTAPTAIDLRNRIAADWYAATLAGDRVVMLAERRHDADDLNRRARNHRAADGHLHGPAVQVEGRDFQAGDRVLCLRNDRRLGVHNGTLATITAVDVERRAMSIRTDAGSVHDLTARYLDAGHLTHGYALTIHKSQGLTVDRCLILGSDTLDHNAGYTALSRGRAENRIYLHAALPDPNAHSRPLDGQPARDALAGALARDRTDRLAIDHQRVARDPDALRAELRHLHTERARLIHVREEMPRNRSADITALTEQRDELADLAAKQRARVDNVHVGVWHRQERLAERVSAQWYLNNTTERLAGVEKALADACSEQRHHEQYQHDRRPDLDRLASVEHRIDLYVDKLVNTYTTRPPAYLRMLGNYPRDTDLQKLWKRTATDIERFRMRHNVTDQRSALGPTPRDGDTALAWRWVNDDLRRARRALDPPSPTRTIDRGLSRGL